MGRPKVPLIDRDEAIAKALELIDRDGIDGLSIRKLGSSLGVHGASLYHHFQDKDEILLGVRLLVMREAQVVRPPTRQTTWQEDLVRTLTRLRGALLRHPNTAPLMAPTGVRPTALSIRDRTLAKMFEAGVPHDHAFAIVDSAEALAYGSALANPGQLPPRERLDIRDRRAELQNLDQALRSAPRTPDRLFRLQLQALIAGWEVVASEAARGRSG